MRFQKFIAALARLEPGDTQKESDGDPRSRERAGHNMMRNRKFRIGDAPVKATISVLVSVEECGPGMWIRSVSVEIRRNATVKISGDDSAIAVWVNRQSRQVRSNDVADPAFAYARLKHDAIDVDLIQEGKCRAFGSIEAPKRINVLTLYWGCRCQADQARAPLTRDTFHKFRKPYPTQKSPYTLGL